MVKIKENQKVYKLMGGCLPCSKILFSIAKNNPFYQSMFETNAIVGFVYNDKIILKMLLLFPSTKLFITKVLRQFMRIIERNKSHNTQDCILRNPQGEENPTTSSI